MAAGDQVQLSGVCDGAQQACDGQTYRLTTLAIAITLFAAILISFCLQSALAEYVQSTLQFRQPFLLFYIAHSSFAFSFPLHLAWLSVSSPTPVSEHIDALKDALTTKFTPNHSSPELPIRRILLIILAVTCGVTLPALLWYASVSLTSISDITALWNANALWAYAFAVPILRTTWSGRAASAVIFAFVGTLAVVYGASGGTTDPSATTPAGPSRDSAASLFGSSLAFVAGVTYALYQVVFKRFIALEVVITQHSGRRFSTTGAPSDASYSAIPAAEDGEGGVEEGLVSKEIIGADLPFGLWSNFWVSAIGICTFVVLGFTMCAIVGIASMGVIFNSCYLVLLGLWGPVLASVGNLLTIVIMLAYDTLVHGFANVTMWSFVGSGAIVIGFAVLAADVLRSPNATPIVD
ncbi:hypothetical protein BKA62DRAFT_748595 [Auriculariales sp. MPI-PUGE-AT-0066]|nr:hypothetical protein BKA62DRAFT_748595 [Auriculariales sp. MPI-PUGE-AT-0066]